MCASAAEQTDIPGGVWRLSFASALEHLQNDYYHCISMTLQAVTPTLHHP